MNIVLLTSKEELVAIGSIIFLHSSITFVSLDEEENKEEQQHISYSDVVSIKPFKA